MSDDKLPKDNRIPVMMSDADLSAIDTWRYDNRVPTRSEAIRKLCRIATEIEPHLQPALDAAFDAVDTLAHYSQAIFGEDFGGEANVDEDAALIFVRSQYDQLHRLIVLLGGLARAAEVFINEDDFTAAVEQIKTSRERLAAIIAAGEED